MTASMSNVAYHDGESVLAGESSNRLSILLGGAQRDALLLGVTVVEV